MESDLAGLGLLDALVGYQRAIIVDSIQTKEGKPGQIYRLGPEDLMASRHSVSPHDVNLLTALELGKTLELEVPQEVIIIAIEVTDVTTFGESCTTEVAAAIPQAVEIVAREVKGETPV
jgi:hydrogenase maturation protease